MMRTPAERLVSQARLHLGYRETPENNTIFGEWLGRNGEPWCAAFVSYCAWKANAPIAATSSTAEMVENFREKGKLGRRPFPGSIVFFAWDKSQDVTHVQHAGIVEKVHDDGTIQTIEGNTGDGVFRRLRNPLYVCGYGYWTVPRTVKFGNIGQTVRLLQAFLGVYVDGVFGQQTRTGVLEFQKSHGLQQDGICGPLTWDALL